MASLHKSPPSNGSGGTIRSSTPLGAGTVALDAMGGDRAPDVVVQGAFEAASGGCSVVLVGPQDVVASTLATVERQKGKALSELPGSLILEHAPEVVDMGEEPLRAIRRKRNSSVVVAAALAAEGRAQAMVSAGSTGAAVAAAVYKMGRIPGIRRPGIATVIPFPNHPIVLIDSGANAECTPRHLVDFAVMGALFSSAVFGHKRPRVGLLNIGSEEVKGAALHRKAHSALKFTGSGVLAEILEFVGNVEGFDLPHGAADVVVTDGFTGNVVLKLSEGLARSLIGEIVSSIAAKTSADARDQAIRALLELRQEVNADGMGGACLLGVNSLAVMAHGSSTAESIARAVKFASSETALRLQKSIAASVERLSSLLDEDLEGESVAETPSF
jgi:phosphate acyltransferase